MRRFSIKGEKKNIYGDYHGDLGLARGPLLENLVFDIVKDQGNDFLDHLGVCPVHADSEIGEFIFTVVNVHVSVDCAIDHILDLVAFRCHGGVF
jgi:hypothetical protein